MQKDKEIHHAAYILRPSLGIFGPKSIAGKLIINPLLRIDPHQTQQTPILQTNESYMPVKDTPF